jgi:hypothetical protein
MATTYLGTLTPRELARQGLQEELSVWEIAVETFPGDRPKQEGLARFLEACLKEGSLLPAPSWRQRAQAHDAHVDFPVGLKVPGL